MKNGLLACLAGGGAFLVVQLGDTIRYAHSPTLLLLSLLATRFVIAPAHWGLGTYLLVHQAFFTLLRLWQPWRVGTTASLPLLVGSVVYLALQGPQKWPCRQGQDRQLARLLLLTGLGVQLGLLLTLLTWTRDHLGQLSPDPLTWTALLATGLVVTRGLQPGLIQLLLAPVLALAVEACCGGLGLAVFMLTVPGGLLLAAALVLGWRLDRTAAVGCLPLLLGVKGVPAWLLILAGYCVARLAWALSQGLAESEELWAEARELGLDRPPALPSAPVRAARVVIRMVDGLSPLAWLLDMSAPLWRRLDGPGPSF